jgi:hypothetical protein
VELSDVQAGVEALEADKKKVCLSHATPARRVFLMCGRKWDSKVQISDYFLC